MLFSVDPKFISFTCVHNTFKKIPKCSNVVCSTVYSDNTQVKQDISFSGTCTGVYS